MKPVLSANEMRECEKRLFETGIPSISVMEEASKGFSKVIFDSLNPEKKTCVFACGCGGNGGDGYAAARLFAQMGGRAIVLSVCEPKTEDARENYLKSKQSVFAVIGAEEIDSLPVPDAWADCLFGIGLTRPIEGVYKKVIDRINADRKKGALVFSCDIPSGLNSDTGEIMGACVCAHKTVTFEFMKKGHFLGSGMDVCGEITLHPIGIDKGFLPAVYTKLIERVDLKSMLPDRRRTAHKNDFGHLLIVAGSVGMAGACAICANAALRSGAGLVTVFCPKSIVPVIQTLAPCAMCIPAEEKDGALSAECISSLKKALSGKNAVAIGPGLSLRAHAGIIEEVLLSSLPCVIDADAINLISMNDSLKKLLSSNHAVTPHPGEARRLLGNLSGDSEKDLKRLKMLGAFCLLKGASTLISGIDGFYISASGTNGMAKGGSGDALCGIVGSFLAQGMTPDSALLAGSEIHGLAGECAERKFGNVSMLPTDLVNCIGDAYEDIYR